MEEVLAEIIEKEKESESIITEARKKAQDIQREADSRTNTVIKDAKDKAASIYTERVNKAEKDAQERYDRQVEAGANLKQNLLEEKKEQIEKLTEEITGKVLSSGIDFS